MKQSGLRRIGVVVAICALAGALAGIAGSAAAPSKSTQAQKKAKAQAKARAKAQRQAFRHGPGGRGLFFGGPGGPGRGPVHSESVVPNADGTGFDTVTSDAGVLKSVDGNTIHIKEGTDKATYKDDVAIDVGSDPTVIRNHERAALSDLKADDHVRVIKAPKGTFVIAEDDAWIAQEKKERDQFGHRHFGPPPPGAPGAPGDNENGSNSSGSAAGGTNS